MANREQKPPTWRKAALELNGHLVVAQVEATRSQMTRRQLRIAFRCGCRPVSRRSRHDSLRRLPCWLGRRV